MEEIDEMHASNKQQKVEMVGIKPSEKQKLEMVHGVHIAEDALTFATQLLKACGDKLNLSKDMDAMQLVERACRRLRETLDSDSEESNLDWDEYFLDRALVEAMEMRKEKSIACRSIFLPHVERDLAEFKRKWECFESKWDPLVAQMRDECKKRVDVLKHLHHQMTSFMEETKLKGYADAKHLAQLLLPSTIATQLQATIPSAFRERLSVGPFEVAKVASSMTGLALKYLQPPFNPRLTLEGLQSKLSEKLIGLDDVIHKITLALSKQKSSTGPFGSFLFLGSHGRGRTILAKTLAEEIFDDKDRFIKLDMSQYEEQDYVSQLVAVLDRDKKNGSIVMFDNIENAPSCCKEVLSQVLRDGRLTDEKGACVSFSHDLVLASSHIGHDVCTHCRCLKDVVPKHRLQELLKEPGLVHSRMDLNPGRNYGACYLRPFYVKVANHFELEFMDLFDDIVVFPSLRPLDHLAISRLQMRDVATSMSTLLKKQVILYPSDAALTNIICCPDLFQRGARAYETWHQAHMDCMLNDDLLKNEANRKIIIYIDVLLGSWPKCSFRVETDRHLEKNLDVKRFKEKLWNIRSRYCREKLQVNKIYMLLRSYFHLFELLHTKDEIDASRVLLQYQEVVELIDDIIESELVHVDNIIENLTCCPRDITRPDKSFLKHVSTRLQGSLKLRDKATRVIIETLLRRLNTSYVDQSSESCHPPASFLCLGLTHLSKEQFSKSLAEHLAVENGEKLLIQVDLSLCTEPESFFRCTYDVDTHLLLKEFVKRSQHSVIVFYGLEMAHISVFSTILSILEDGVSKDNDGDIIDFGNSVVVIISDLGNKEMIGGFNGYHSKIMMSRMEYISLRAEGVGSVVTEEMGFRGLRFELLHRLDHMLLFDPFSDDQLNVFAKLLMKSLREKFCRSLYVAFVNLFNGKRCKISPVSYNTDDLLESIKEAGGKDAIVRYGWRGYKSCEVIRFCQKRS